jgi:hypothetical protein
MSFWAFSIAFVAAPRDAPGARLNETVTTGNWPWWFTDSGPLLISKCVNVLSGTAAPLIDDTAPGAAEPVLTAVFVVALGLDVEVAEPPDAVVAVTTSVEAVVNAEGAIAERT